MPPVGHKFYAFILCNKRTKPGERRRVCHSLSRFLAKNFLVEPKSEDVICDKCRRRHYRQKEQNTSKTVNCTEFCESDDDYTPPTSKPRRDNNLSSPPSVRLSIPSTSKTHSYCFLCKKPGHKLINVPSKARFSTFLHNEIIIPAGSRCCPVHLQVDSFTSEAISTMKCTNNNVILNRTTIVNLLKNLRDAALCNEKSRINFDDEKILSETDYLNLTGLRKEDFIDLHTYTENAIRNTPARSTRTSLGIFLFKLKTGISSRVLSTVFGISKSSIKRAVANVREALNKNSVPRYLGFGHISRAEVIENHTRPLAQTLFGSGSEAILVLDGTYIYLQKSGNFQFQRRTYSLHKGRPLVKPMVVVTTTGYFIAMLGPYMADAKNNDGSILNHMLASNVQDIKNWIEKEDIFIVDRGFRDSLDFLEDFGINAKMPSFIQKGQAQMTTEEANTSRLVTKVKERSKIPLILKWK